MTHSMTPSFRNSAWISFETGRAGRGSMLRHERTTQVRSGKAFAPLPNELPIWVYFLGTRFEIAHRIS
jgi:hypothetical protein